jgi:hypothetical protein
MHHHKGQIMTEQVEISSFDLQYECCRMKSKSAEKILIHSIITHGIREPLQGVDKEDGQKILLNGFKRVRCARRLGIGIVPWQSFGNEESTGILELLRISNAKSLTVLEQARLIDELRSVHKMCNADIALLLEKSKAWVSMRTGIIKEMSPFVMDKIFNGEFPVYSYMYTLRRFIRMNCVQKDDIDVFVKSMSGKNISIRDIEILAHGYFKGSNELRNEIKSGNISWGLKRLRESSKAVDCNGVEQKLLKDLEIVQKYMQRIVYKSCDKRLVSGSFYARADLFTGGILRQLTSFNKAVRNLHDRSGQTQGSLLSS